VPFEREPNVNAALCRADFRLSNTLIECKSDVTTAALNKALRQCWIYKVLAGEDCMVMVPDDVHPRKEWLVVFEKWASVCSRTARSCKCYRDTCRSRPSTRVPLYGVVARCATKLRQAVL
jgi:hypothetical protein